MAESEYFSRRSTLVSRRGMCASSQPLATEAGLRTLQAGGTAADAAVAMAAALNVCEPCSTGIGGDAFVLWYDAKRKVVESLQGNGKSPAGLTLALVTQRGHKGVIPNSDALSVVVPGAAAAWVDTVERYGKLPLAQVLEPAIQLADEGWAVGPVTAHQWANCEWQLGNGPHGAELMFEGTRAPRAGEVMHNKTLANTFRLVAAQGKKGFYQGPVAEAVVKVLGELGGVMSLEDLSSHESALASPICSTYKGITVWEVPPPTQGIAALLALNILEAYEAAHPGVVKKGGAAYQHVAIEAMRLAFADSLTHVADPQHHSDNPYEEMLSKKFAAARAREIKPDVAISVKAGPTGGVSDTVYFCSVDGEGNGCSMINSNYTGFGTGIVPKGCGFSLQSRGQNFSLDPSHPNCVGPRKRPYHTIIPGLATWPPKKEGEEAGPLYCVFGVMGGFMQPQGHLQVLSNMLDYGSTPQAAIDHPRFCITALPNDARGHGPHSVEISHVDFEAGPGREEMAEELRKMGHDITVVSGWGREVFGRGQIIWRDPKSGVLWGGSEGRADGCAMGW